MKKRVVIKIGSSNIIHENRVDEEKMVSLAGTIKDFKDNHNIEFIIVSSGAVACGREKLGLLGKNLSIRQRQALAAIGQPYLMRKYKETFGDKGIVAAQVLLTSEDLSNRKRYINSRETIFELLKFGAIPIINENDTVSVDEIKIGDNDNLSALVAAAVDADLLIILSDIDGLYDSNPKTNPEAKLVSDVTKVTKEIMDSAGGAGSKVGTGGMITKLEAAKICMSFGIEMIITNGTYIENIKKIINGADIGTKFHPEKNKSGKRKKWIKVGLKPKGIIYIDEGAVVALKNGKSLLPGGIYEVKGNFGIGDLVVIKNAKEEEIAKGLVNYGASETEKIKRVKSSEIETVLGYKYQEEVVHRDNMIVL